MKGFIQVSALIVLCVILFLAFITIVSLQIGAESLTISTRVVQRTHFYTEPQTNIYQPTINPQNVITNSLEVL